MRRHPAGMLAALLCFPILLATARAQPALTDVPYPVPGEFKPEVRQMLEGARERFERMRATATGSELGIAYGRLGLHYFAHELQDAARAAFENAAVLDPDNYRWPYYLAVLFEETGAYDSAVRHYERALSLNPDDTAVATRLGLALLELNQVERAGVMFERVLAHDPTSAAAHAGLASVADSADRFEDAERHYLQALDLDPQADQLHYRLGQLYRRHGDLDKARKHLELRGVRIPSIDDPTLRFMQAHARPADDYVVLGKLALTNSELERAYKFFDLAAAIDPDNAPALVGKARIAYSTGDLTRTREYTSQAYAIAPRDAQVLQLLGLLADQDGNLDAAIGRYRAALNNDADFHAVRALLANALMRAGRYQDAAAQYATLAERSEAHQGLRFQAGMAFVAAGDCPNAENNLLAAYEKDPDNPQVILALSRVYATCPGATDEQRQIALKFAEALYNSVPNMETSETYAMTLAASARFDDAIDLQTQAIFEALKLGVAENHPQLRTNMQRYRDGQRAVAAWPPDDKIFSALPLVETRPTEPKP